MNWFIVYKGRSKKGNLLGYLSKAGITYYMPKVMKRGESKETLIFSNLIFLQTDTPIDQLIHEIDGLKAPYIDRTHAAPAVVSDSEMQRFMKVVSYQNVQAEFLPDPFVFFKKHKKVRVSSGEFEGYEGYIVRIRKDRKLVISLGEMAIAINGISHELLESIE